MATAINFELIERKRVRKDSKPYGLRWWDSKLRKKKSEFFKTKADRNKYISKANELVQANGMEALRLAKAQGWNLKRYAQIEERLAGRATVEEILGYWEEHHPSKLVVVPFAEAWESYIQVKTFEKVDSDYIRHLRAVRKRFEPYVLGRDWARLTVNDAREWLLSLRTEDGKPFEAVTLQNYRKYLRTFYYHAIEHGQAKNNPFARLKKMPKPVQEEVTVISNDDLRKLLYKALEIEPKFCGPLALAFFAGLRPSSIYRLTAADIQKNERLITLPAKNFKTKRRTVIQSLSNGEGLPENVWPWLEYTPDTYWKWLTKRRFESTRSMIAQAAGVVLAKDVARHSFASNHLARHGKAAATATLLGHRGDQQVLYDHYIGHSNESKSKIYFGFLPESVWAVQAC